MSRSGGSARAAHRCRRRIPVVGELGVRPCHGAMVRKEISDLLDLSWNRLHKGAAMRRVLIVLAAAALLGGAAPAAASTTEGVPHFGHVFVIIGENTELGQINKSDAPFLLNTVKPHAAWLSNYFAVTHFSEANYAAMTSGQFTRCEQFDGAIASCHQNVQNLFNQLDAAGISWQSWLESMPSPCYVVSAGSAKTLNHYGAKHNPAVFYDRSEE